MTTINGRTRFRHRHSSWGKLAVAEIGLLTTIQTLARISMEISGLNRGILGGKTPEPRKPRLSPFLRQTMVCTQRAALRDPFQPLPTQVITPIRR